MKIKKYLSHSPLFALYQAQSILEGFQRQLLRHDVHFIQGLILTALLFEEREVRPRDLKTAFQIQASNLSHALRDLERKGLVRRALHQSDARGFLFGLSATGRKKALALVKEYDAIQEHLEGALGAKKTREMVEHILYLTTAYKKTFPSS